MTIVLLWDNFGPIHVDRCDAVARRFGTERQVIGLELFGRSSAYDWISESGATFEKVTLFPTGNERTIGPVQLARAIVRQCRRSGASDVFLCNYNLMGIFLAASALRLMGCRVYATGCSKFDDRERSLGRELAKSVFYWPYNGGISSGIRARDYMRFLGVPEDRIKTEYNTLSIERIRRLAGVPPAPEGMPWGERHFTIVARFVEKKNLAIALRGYGLYRSLVAAPRDLNLCGSGPLEGELRRLVAELGLDAHVRFHGFLQTGDIAKMLGATLAMVLPSKEEQFGNVVIEAQAMGLPVILTDNCGARDRLIRSGVNGFVFEPDSPEGLAYFMSLLSEDEALWRRMALGARQFAPLGDVEQFARAVGELVAR